MDISIALIASYSLTGIGVIILALCLLFFSISKETVDAGIIVIYILSCFLAGIIIGKKQKTKRFLWGMLIGIAYYTILYFACCNIVDVSDSLMSEVITTLLICCASATLGGMLS